MKTEEAIKTKLEEYKKRYKDSVPYLAEFTRIDGVIKALEWVLED